MTASGNEDNGYLPPRELINEDGLPFTDEIPELKAALERLTNPQRKAFRNANASAIANHRSARVLIVAGPGAGKSYLFLSRIKYWLLCDREGHIYVSSFVRRLVKDLQIDIENELSDAEQKRVTVSTLHGLARSVLERSHGTFEQSMRLHIKIIAEAWKNMVWSDVRLFHLGLGTSHSVYALEK